MPRAWFERDAPVLAPLLLGKLLVSAADPDPAGVHAREGEAMERERAGRRVVGRITEVEAYAEHDPASHTFRGPTPRNRVMFGPAGHLYVYLSYGIHRCANVVASRVGSGQAVLLRAVEPVAGIETIRQRRRGRPDRSLVDGPGKLCEGFGIGLHHNGLDLTVASPVWIADDGTAPPGDPLIGPRVGITRAVEVPWRFRVPPNREPG